MKRLNLPKETTFTGPALMWKRIVAFAIDMAIINLLIFYPFSGLFSRIIPKDYSFSDAYRLLDGSAGNLGFLSSASFAMAVLAVMYFLLQERKMQQTIGKMLMKIYVAGDNSGLKAWQLLVRNLVLLPVFPFFLLWIADPVFMLFNRDGQRLSEILSKTRVVERYSIEQQV